MGCVGSKVEPPPPAFPMQGMQGGAGPMVVPLVVPTQAEVFAAWGAKLMASPVFAKFTKVHAKLMTEAGEVTTVIDGVKETSNSYAAGSYLVENEGSGMGERYAVDGATFKKRYLVDTPAPATTPALADEGFQLFTACGRVWAYRLTQAECEESFPSNSFMAPWGEPMRIEPGDYLCVPNPAGGEVYRIEKGAFAKTYAPAPTVSVS